ncbi:LCP family protein [Marmoricola sp. URHB0036]|uniref:LCP family protein n=1 Tax=Marmoricola sp. URHB0036 TaxID=1298863 RepID=UPI000408DBAD|nr:LCP family protein [Marmoricola sp. URHB0036]
MSEEEPRHKDRVPRRRRVTTKVLIALAVVLLIVSTAFVIAYKKLEGNINAIPIGDALGKDRPKTVDVGGPQNPLNILIMGSDNRDGTKIGGDTPGLSDTTILLHLSADRKRAYGVSIPRDTMVDRPDCKSKDGKKTIPGGLIQFNTAYAVGGPLCTIHTVEKITDVRIDHFVVINFAGFKEMVNAVNGVQVCVPKEVNDNVGHIHLPAGTYKVNGNQALDYVRVRHDIGAETGDIGRMKRQQAFISAMIKKVVSKGTLANPVRLYKFLDAATKSLTTDTGFAHLKELASLGSSLKNIGLDNIQFITVPNETYQPDPNRLQLAPGAADVWRKIRFDKPLGRLSEGAVSPGSTKADGTPSSSPSPNGTPSSNPSQSAQQAEAKRKQEAEEAGLCA